MKKLINFILPLSFLGCSFFYSPKKNQQERVSALCKNNECRLLLGGKEVDTRLLIKNKETKGFEYFGSSNDFLKKIDGNGKKEFYLLNESHGDGCPSIFRIVTVDNLKGLSISSFFGNCNEIIKMNLAKHSISFQFPKLKEANRKQLHVLFDRDNNIIHNDPGIIFSVCFEENRWTRKEQDKKYHNLGSHSECTSYKKWRAELKRMGSIIIGRDLSKKLTKEPIYISVESVEPRMVPRKGTAIITGFDLNKNYMVKVLYMDNVIKEWKLNFNKMKTNKVKIFKSPGYWRLEKLK